jgi:hypothetical protein
MMSNEVKLNECIAKLEKAGAYDTFRVKRIAAFKENGHPLPIKETLKLAESVLETATRYVEKHNGRSDRGETFTESGWPEYQNLDESADPRERQVKSYMMTCNISEADARKVLGLPSKEVRALSRRQRAEYSTAISCGISEADALRLATKV